MTMMAKITMTTGTATDTVSVATSVASVTVGCVGAAVTSTTK